MGAAKDAMSVAAAKAWLLWLLQALQPTPGMHLR